MEKINVAELLRNCPKGMELDCYLFNGLEFDHIDTDNENYPIVCRAKTLSCEYNIHSFTKYGWFTAFFDYSKCVIYPKGRTTWEGFVPPCKFNDGDIIYNRLQKKICIYYLCEDEVPRIKGCRCNESNIQLQFEKLEYPIPIAMQDYRFATEEEKEKLFKAIKDNGYKWNAETKTLEKLTEPKFKVGDKIRHKTHIRQGNAVTEIKDTHYILDDELALPFTSQDDYELVPNKFDINTLVPFESRVLVRQSVHDIWKPAYWGKYAKNVSVEYPFITSYGSVRYCIPYKDNEHLLGNSDECDEYFKNW